MGTSVSTIPGSPAGETAIGAAVPEPRRQPESKIEPLTAVSTWRPALDTRTPSRCWAAALLLALALFLAHTALLRHAPEAPVAAFGNLPLAFERNEGQLAPDVRFASRGDGREIEVLADGLRLRPAAAQTSLRFRMGHARSPHGDRALPGKVHYLRGRDSRHWRRNIGTFAAVRREEAFPGVDVVYYGRGRELEYDFLVAPGADPDAIQVAVEGVSAASVDAGGDLVLESAAGELRHRRPVAYQERNGQREPVVAEYLLADNGTSFGFRLGEYDRSRPLVIDPVLVYSTYFGGNGADLALGGGIAVDGAGSAYVAGETDSTNLPGTEGGRPGGFRDVFVTKLNPAGTGVIYTTYLGGTDSDAARGIAVGPDGSVTITGETFSRDFPVANALQPQLAGFPSSDAFVTRLDATGGTLLYSTFLGGAANDVGRAIALDSAGNAWVTGATSSANFPVRSAAQSVQIGGSDAFATCIAANGSEVLASTFLGGNASDRGAGIAVGPGDVVVVCGATESSDFPVRNAIQPTKRFGRDGFVTRFTSGVSAIDFSTFLGSSGSDAATGVAVDPTSAVCVTGYASSSDFPQKNPGQPRFGGRADAFVTRFTPAGDALIYSTLLGGGGVENNGVRETGAIAVDPTGSAFVTGFTDSADFPKIGAFQTKPGKHQDAFVARLSPTGGAWVYSSYMGGKGDDAGLGIALDGDANAFVVGGTTSTNFPLRNPAQRGLSGGADGFIAKVGVVNAAVTPVLVLPSTTIEFGSVLPGRASVKTLKITNGGLGRLVCAISGFADPYTLLAGGTTVTVQKGKSKSLFLQFHPTEPGEFNVPLTIETNDPYFPLAVVQLHGTCPAPGGG